MNSAIKRMLATILLAGSFLTGMLTSTQSMALGVTCATDTNANHLSQGRAYYYYGYRSTSTDLIGYAAHETTTLVRGLNHYDRMYWFLDINNLCQGSGGGSGDDSGDDSNLSCNPDDLNRQAIASAKISVSENANMHGFVVKHCGEVVDSWFSPATALLCHMNYSLLPKP